MPRQFSNLKIDSLEKLFDERRTNPDVLTSILGELSHRKTPRAKKLRERVIQALAIGTSGSAALSDHPKALNPFPSPADDAALFIRTPAEHRRAAEIYRKGGPDWTAEERAHAMKLAEHHEMVAKGIERRTGKS